MAKRSNFYALPLCTLVCLSAATAADDSGGFCEVVEVTPSRPIDHEVDLKCPFDAQVTETYLNGPLYFSHSVSFGQHAAREPSAYLNWYRIRKPVAEPQRTVTVRYSLGDKETQQTVVQNAAFLLAPTRRITSGPPSPVPADLCPFKAYEIADAGEKNRKVELAGTFGPHERVIVRAAYLCLPVELRHHDDSYPVKNQTSCMLVFEMQEKPCTSNITTLDLFGMNKLKAKASNWLCVPAQIVEDSSDEGE